MLLIVLIISEVMFSEPFHPLKSDHPIIGQVCSLCFTMFKVGDVTTLVSIGPLDDKERKKAAQGRAHNAEALPVHWSCTQGDK